MKYTANYILWKEANSKDQYPVYLRITIERKRSYIATGYRVFKNQWDEKSETVKSSHPLAVEINADLQTRKSNIIKRVVTIQMDGKNVTAAELKKFATTKDGGNNFFAFAAILKDELKNKRNPRTIINYQKFLNRLEGYHKSKNLIFEEIDSAYLVSFENHVRESGGSNYANSLFNIFRMFFNAAKKRGLTTNYPFSVYEMPIYAAPDKDHFSLEELNLIEEYIDKTNILGEKMSAIYFLLGSYTGLRISDWFQFDINKHIKDGFILLRATKNGEWISMPISEPLKRNIYRIKKYPLKIAEKNINESLKKIAKKLKIKKDISSHTGRHTFAVTLCYEMGIGCETCAELMGISVKTCVDNYYRVTQNGIINETKTAWARLK